MNFEFGVMSSKWELKAPDLKTAQIAMAMFIAKDIPIAIYEPEQIAFLPREVLVLPVPDNKEAIRDAIESINEVTA
jgi:hypothetical protein